MSKTNWVVIEVKGGIVQEIYSDLNEVEFMVVDWDNIEQGDGAEIPCAVGLKRMPDEVNHEFENVKGEYERRQEKLVARGGK